MQSFASILNRAMFSARNVIICLIIIAISGFVLLSLRQVGSPAVAPSPSPTKEPDIATIESVPEAEASEVYSPDGKMKLLMSETISEDNTIYSFSVLDTSGGANKEIFLKTVLSGISFEMSPNAWSPDNKYFFITEKNGNSINYLVFRADGEYFSETEKYIDVVPRFTAKNTGYTLSDITGWDSETLLHVYTLKEDGTQGPSFWFEIPSKATIQLASR